MKEFKKLIKTYKPKIILFNTKNIFLLQQAVNLQKDYKYKCFFDVRSLPVNPNRFTNSIDNVLFKKSLETATTYFNGVSYITEEMRKYCIKTYKLSDHKSTIWTSGVNTELFKPFRYRIGSSSKDLKIIYHGTLSDNRGLCNILFAVKLLKNYNIKVIFIGHGNGLSKLKKTSSELQLEEKITFIPTIPFRKIPFCINQADIGILPFPNWNGWNTSSPIKLFEYLSCGKPVIVTKIPAHINILKGKEFAFWAENSTPTEIAKAIKNAYISRTKFTAWTESTKNLVLTNYTWEKQASKLLKFLINNE